MIIGWDGRGCVDFSVNVNFFVAGFFDNDHLVYTTVVVFDKNVLHYVTDFFIGVVANYDGVAVSTSGIEDFLDVSEAFFAGVGIGGVASGVIVVVDIYIFAIGYCGSLGVVDYQA